MSNIQNSYDTEPSQNTALGTFSLVEGETSYDDMDDIIRQMMADIREESDDLRTLIAALNARLTATTTAADSATEGVQQALDLAGVLSEQVAAAQETATNAETAATAAQTAAEAASDNADAVASGITDRMTAVETLAGANQENVTALDERVGNIEASGTGADYVQTDGVSIGQSGGVLSVLDVPVAGDTSDLASGRGQIGRTAIPAELADLDTLIADGWYAISDEALNLPEGVTEGVCRVSSGFTSSTVVQTLFTYAGTPRVYVRSATDAGQSWTSWAECLFFGAVGEGLHFENGTLSISTDGGMSLVPAVTEDEADKVLSGAGTWVERATPEDVKFLTESLNELTTRIDELDVALAEVRTIAGAAPDGSTIDVVDGALSVPTYTGATGEDDGAAGLVPAADTDERELYLRGDGTWGNPADGLSGYEGATEETDGTTGLVPAATTEEAGLFLRGDGIWSDPTAALLERIAALEETVVALASSGETGGNSNGGGE